MDSEQLLDLLETVMQEHHPDWVLKRDSPEYYFTVICSCGERVKYNEHLRELLRERVAASKAASKKDEETDDEV